MTYADLNNLAAVRFEEGKLDECIVRVHHVFAAIDYVLSVCMQEVCQKAVDEGREMRADCRFIPSSSRVHTGSSSI